MSVHYPVQCHGVWKSFRRGEFHDSLVGFLSDALRRLWRRGGTEDDVFWALRDVNLQVAAGEALGVIGPNGAGKSTLLKLLTRIMGPNRGHVQADGRVSSMIEVSAGFHGDLTGRENVYLRGAILGMRRREIRAKLDSIVSFAGVGEFLDTPLKRFSSGMQARLGFAVAAHVEPDVLLIDEVLSVGDAAYRDKCIRFMADLKRRGTAIVFVSHNLSQVRRLCDRTLVLDAGVPLHLGDTAEAIRIHVENMQGEIDRSHAPATGPARLRGLAFTDADGEPAAAARHGEPLGVYVQYEILEDVAPLYLRVIFHDITGDIVAVCQGEPGALARSPGSHVARLCIDDVPFGRRGLLVSCSLFDADAKERLDVHFRRYYLPIEGGGGEYPVTLRHRWLSEG